MNPDFLFSLFKSWLNFFHAAEVKTRVKTEHKRVNVLRIQRECNTPPPPFSFDNKSIQTRVESSVLSALFASELTAGTRYKKPDQIQLWGSQFNYKRIREKYSGCAQVSVTLLSLTRCVNYLHKMLLCDLYLHRPALMNGTQRFLADNVSPIFLLIGWCDTKRSLTILWLEEQIPVMHCL